MIYSQLLQEIPSLTQLEQLILIPYSSPQALGNDCQNQLLDFAYAYWTQLISLDEPYITVSVSQIPIDMGENASIISKQFCPSNCHTQSPVLNKGLAVKVIL